MSVVWKYELGQLPSSTVEMPVAASLLHLDVQGGVPCLWALVDPGADREPRTFMHIGTGHNFDYEELGREGRYVGSYQLDLPGGVFVGHVFERRGA